MSSASLTSSSSSVPWQLSALSPSLSESIGFLQSEVSEEFSKSDERTPGSTSISGEIFKMRQNVTHALSFVWTYHVVAREFDLHNWMNTWGHVLTSLQIPCVGFQRCLNPCFAVRCTLPSSLMTNGSEEDVFLRSFASDNPTPGEQAWSDTPNIERHYTISIKFLKLQQGTTPWRSFTTNIDSIYKVVRRPGEDPVSRWTAAAWGSKVNVHYRFRIVDRGRPVNDAKSMVDLALQHKWCHFVHRYIDMVCSWLPTNACCSEH